MVGRMQWFMGVREETVEGIRLDWRLWPVLVVTPPEYVVTDTQLLAFFERYQTMTGNHPDRTSVVVDLRTAARMPAAQRKLLTEALSGAKAAIESRMVATALVFDSALLRGMLTAVFWVFRPAYPVRVFATVEEAALWCQDLHAEQESDRLRIA